jgi:3-methyladenine DNA glycosylase/8-oxoguanine DNA glycosylase
MSKLTVIAGDFPVGAGRFTIRNFTLPGDENHYLCETVAANQVTVLNKATEEFLLLLDTDDKTKEFIEKAGQDQVFFMAKLRDKRRFVAATDRKTFNKIIRAIERETNIPLDITPSAA